MRLGQKSMRSGTPSPSASGNVTLESGQPSSSWNPLNVSGSEGHASIASGNPSLSVSTTTTDSSIVSGQPSSSKYRL